jgi:hypothetical protein
VYRLSKVKQSNEERSFPLLFIDEMLERLANHAYFCFLDGYSGFMQIPVHPDDQHKTTFTCLMEHLHIEGYPSVYAMLPPLFKIA